MCKKLEERVDKMGELRKKRTVGNGFKIIVAVILVLVLIALVVFLKLFQKPKEKTGDEKAFKTLYFVDKTQEQWIRNDSAMIELVDNTDEQESYWMVRKSIDTWYVNVPGSVDNITFNCYSSDKSTKYDTWNAGERGDKDVYYAEDEEIGHWDVPEERVNLFYPGDIIYLDFTEFPEWKNDDAIMYINFSDVSKEENQGKEILLDDVNDTYSPKLVDMEVEDSIYAYMVTFTDAGAKKLRFWRGNELSLWDCSVVLSYEDYSNGINCVKVTGWNEDGSLEFSKCCMDFELDSDEDGIKDYLEMLYELNRNSKDSDGDGLEDSQEIYYTGTNPGKYDSVEEGISDTDADKDGDGLSSAEEIRLGLNAYDSDTDKDGLMDGDEVNLYGTEPKNVDTDGDTLNDGDEVALGLSPLLQDTDGNGTLDCDEKRYFELTLEVENSEKPEVKKVFFAFEGTGNVYQNTSVEDLYKRDIRVSEVVGLVGVPVGITGDSNFDTAKICFYLSEEVDDETLSNLVIFWYNEEIGRFVELETVIEKENRMVSAKVEQFGKYMVLDYRKWSETWTNGESWGASVYQQE